MTSDRWKRRSLPLLAAVGLAAASAPAAADAGAAAEDGLRAHAAAELRTPRLTPLLLRQEGPPIRPVRGSDGRWHLLWSVELENATPLRLTLPRVQVLAGRRVLATFGRRAVARMVEVHGTRTASGRIGGSQGATLFLDVSFARRAQIPAAVTHRVVAAAPQFPRALPTTGARTPVARRAAVPVLGPPLEPGAGYVAADTCCTSTRHIRAPIPADNRYWFGQRFAVDWEQVDAAGRIVDGDPGDPAGYEIWGKRAIAVADGRVVGTRDGLPTNRPGTLPGAALGLDRVDGNSVVLSLGDGLYAMYAHLQAGSLRVRVGDRVRRGQTLGLVGSSGNSQAPHLHFQVNDGPLPLAANGVPYVIDRFSVAGAGRSTADFDAAEAGRSPLATRPAPGGDGPRTRELPLDLSLVTFG